MFSFLPNLGVPITSGVRYILTGFCNYVDPDVSHQNFMASYDRLYDGSAASGKKGRHTDTSFSAESTSTSEGSDLDFTGQMSEPSSSVKLAETDSGIRTGDLLKGIWVNYNDLASLEQIKDFSTFKVDKRLYPEDSSGIRNSVGDQESGSLSANESGVYILTDGLSTEEIKKVVGFSRSSHRTMASSVLIQRDNQAEEETPLNEVQRNFPRTAQGLLSTGKYWSYDECLSGEE